MEKIKKFFKIEKKYTFEWNDLRCAITILNVALIMIFGLSVAWFGLAVATIGLLKDFLVDRHVSGMLMHLANIVLNISFMVAA